jgi:hypothetical protein
MVAGIPVTRRNSTFRNIAGLILPEPCKWQRGTWALFRVISQATQVLTRLGEPPVRQNLLLDLMHLLVEKTLILVYVHTVEKEQAKI